MWTGPGCNRIIMKHLTFWVDILRVDIVRVDILRVDTVRVDILRVDILRVDILGGTHWVRLKHIAIAQTDLS